MPRLEAASSSCTSMQLPFVISTQAAHVPQGLAVGPCWQSSILATMRAVEVLPVPRAPQKRNACATRSMLMALLKARAMWDWPTSSSREAGRYFRARTTYDMAAAWIRQGPPASAVRPSAAHFSKPAKRRTAAGVTSSCRLFDGHGQGRRHTALPLPLLPLGPGGVRSAAVAASLAHDTSFQVALQGLHSGSPVDRPPRRRSRRRDRDSNPGYPFGVHPLSRRVP